MTIDVYFQVKGRLFSANDRILFANDRLLYHSIFIMILAFAEYDTNNSGEISKQELLDWCSKHGDITDNIDSLISGADFNGDGKINYDEFICMVVKKQI